jgi:hypothetical protein
MNEVEIEGHGSMEDGALGVKIRRKERKKERKNERKKKKKRGKRIKQGLNNKK